MSKKNENAFSPMIKQYLNIKEKNNDSILFFRLGDFYEMFFEDAKLVSKELGITLTAKDCGNKEKAPMCGVPYHSCEAYISRLIAKGYKISMCDQMVDNTKPSRGLVERQVVRVVTPGTIIDGDILDETKNNYICSIYCADILPIIGISFCDVSTGEFKITEILGNDNELVNQVKIELGKFSPKEILCIVKEKIYKDLYPFLKEKLQCNIEIIKDTLNDVDSIDILKDQFGKEKIEKSKIDDKISAVKSIAYLVNYLKDTQKGNLKHIGLPAFYDKSQFMGLDLNTIRNLELLETMRTKSKEGSLLGVIDNTRTAMGKRLLRSWIERPLLNIKNISLRQDAVEELCKDIVLRENLRESLLGIYDIHRIMTKVSYGTANARDLKGLEVTLQKFPSIKKVLSTAKSELFKKLDRDFDTLAEVCSLIENSIEEKPPLTVKEGGIIKDGFSLEIDRLRNDINGSKDNICQIEERERKKTGISKLKISYNKVYGYYIEVTNSYKHLVPDYYTRRQTLTGCERYITDELKDLESKVLYAKDVINETEYKIFEEIRKKVAKEFSKIIKIANIISTLDVILSFSQVAVCNNYVKPKVNSSNKIVIKQGRHPVVEQLVPNDFVPNDLFLDDDKHTIMIITGPNMGGKSTYMRQNALIVLMAQIGSFVPASEATIGIVDNVFTRIGASDDLAAGQSTFMVEMSEVANIIKNATSKSLLILDEVGRGTSTFDGMSIARSVLEHVSDKKKLGAKTLFATHYHEITEISKEFDNIQNYSVTIEKSGDEIRLLHGIQKGAANDSYAIEVAKLAGVPDCIVTRAKEILKSLNNEKNLSEFIPTLKKDPNENKKVTNEIIKNLNDINISNLSPLDSMNILYKLISLVKNHK